MIGRNSKLLIGVIIILFFTFLSSAILRAEEQAEETIDSDGDGYSDEAEIISGYSPYNSDKIKIEKSDVDKDGLSDYFELKFKTDVLNSDSDSDGYLDGQEIDLAHNPLSTSTKKISQRIEIDTKNQKLVYFVGGIAWKEFIISSGKPSMPTPKGKYKIINKSKKAWSKKYQLWMPFWMGLNRGEFGIHELPLWPSGYREGANHLGKAVSHGCIRLGIGPAQYLFDRVEVGVEVTIR